VPLYAATIARARLTNLSQRLSTAAARPLAAPLHGWPPGRALALLHLTLLLFPASDRRHPVVTPLQLLLGRWLGTCTATSPLEAALALALADLAAAAAATGGRWAPETLTLLAGLLRGYLPACASGGGGGGGGAVPRGLLTLQGGGGAGAAAAGGGGGALSLSEIMAAANAAAAAAVGAAAAGPGAGPGTPPVPAASPAAAPGSDAFKAALLHTALGSCSAAVAGVAALDACPEVLAPLGAAAAELAACPGFAAAAPAALVARVRGLAGEVAAAGAAAVARRRPLALLGAQQAPPARKEFNPRFEQDFEKGGGLWLGKEGGGLMRSAARGEGGCWVPGAGGAAAVEGPQQPRSPGNPTPSPGLHPAPAPTVPQPLPPSSPQAVPTHSSPPSRLLTPHLAPPSPPPPPPPSPPPPCRRQLRPRPPARRRGQAQAPGGQGAARRHARAAPGRGLHGPGARPRARAGGWCWCVCLGGEGGGGEW
jgi:hypothetical protein